jgi:hypothetical protein
LRAGQSRDGSATKESGRGLSTTGFGFDRCSWPVVADLGSTGLSVSNSSCKDPIDDFCDAFLSRIMRFPALMPKLTAESWVATDSGESSVSKEAIFLSRSIPSRSDISLREIAALEFPVEYECNSATSGWIVGATAALESRLSLPEAPFSGLPVGNEKFVKDG